jgi:hypothetical protein
MRSGREPRRLASGSHRSRERDHGYIGMGDKAALTERGFADVTSYNNAKAGLIYGMVTLIAFRPPYHQEARVADPPVLRPPVESGEYTAHLFRTTCDDRMPIRRSMGGPPRTSGDRILAPLILSFREPRRRPAPLAPLGLTPTGSADS